uniref:GG11915 n=2 Tax=Drosophila erecta TaxID=7220 RepID=B3P548_DROER
MGGHNCRSLVTRPSYTIRHQYPGPLVTYDGEARCEPRFIRISDLNCSTMELIFQAYGDDEDEMAGIFEENIEMGENCGKSKKNFGCQASLPTEDDCIDVYSEDEEREGLKSKLFYFLKNTFAPKKSALNCRLNGGKEESGFEDYSATRKQLRALEDQARGIYETYVESFPNSPSWDILKPAQKLRFQWKALTGDDLMETPYENFTLSFSRGFLETFPFASGTTVQNEQRIAWCNLDRCQRMPFILQALLYQVASGAIDPEDHCAVREHFHKLR